MSSRDTTRLISHLREISREKHLSLYRLSKEIQVAPSTLNQIAKGGRTIDAVVLIKICDRLGCKPGDILDVLPPL